MAPRFVPVSDPEKARCEQNEEDLRKHRQFDTPFALLPKDLNNPKTKKGDNEPINKKAEGMVLDAKQLWRKQQELFAKPETWGRETSVFVNPEQTRDQNATQKRRPGDVGWGVQGSFGGKSEDNGLLTLQRGEVDQGLELNDKGLWVKKKGKVLSEAGPGLSDGAESLLKPLKQGEDPRMEGAKQKGRGGEDAAKRALEALESRRRGEKSVQEEMGMRKPPPQRSREGAYQTSSSQMVQPSKRSAKYRNYQTVHSSDEGARKAVEKALGHATIASEAVAHAKAVVAQVGSGGVKRTRSPSPVVLHSESEAEGDSKFAWQEDADEDKDSGASGSGGAAGEEIEVDFF